jgi:hypothetical protein
MKNYITLTVLGLIALNGFNPIKTNAQMRDRNDFFRQGDRQLELEIQRIQEQRSETPLLTIQGSDQTWQAILFQEAGFSVWLPSGIFRQEMVEINTDAGMLTFPVLASHLEKSHFLASYSQPIAETNLTESETLFNQIRDGIIRQTNSELVGETSLNLETGFGRELILKNPESELKLRLYLINQRFYVLGVGSEPNEASTEAIATFFESFKLID